LQVSRREYHKRKCIRASRSDRADRTGLAGLACLRIPNLNGQDSIAERAASRLGERERLLGYLVITSPALRPWR
jgi:hypothetical protein